MLITTMYGHGLWLGSGAWYQLSQAQHRLHHSKSYPWRKQRVMAVTVLEMTLVGCLLNALWWAGTFTALIKVWQTFNAITCKSADGCKLLCTALPLERWQGSVRFTWKYSLFRLYRVNTLKGLTLKVRKREEKLSNTDITPLPWANHFWFN